MLRPHGAHHAPHAAPDNDGATADDNAPAEAAAETETSCATVRR